MLEKCERIADEVEGSALAQFSEDKLSDLRILLKILLSDLRDDHVAPSIPKRQRMT
jgi:hypothetical protein